jgi:hypothetical protein
MTEKLFFVYMMASGKRGTLPTAVIPAKAGIQEPHPPAHPTLDSRLRGNDAVGVENQVFLPESKKPKWHFRHPESLNPTSPLPPVPCRVIHGGFDLLYIPLI